MLTFSVSVTCRRSRILFAVKYDYRASTGGREGISEDPYPCRRMKRSTFCATGASVSMIGMQCHLVHAA